MPITRVTFAAALASTVVLALTGCSGPGGNAERSERPDVATAEAGPGAAATDAGTSEGAPPEAGTSEAVTSEAVADAPAGRSRVFTASLSVEVGDLTAARRQAEAAVAAVGGFVATEDLDNSSGSVTRSTITYRVPPEHFRSTLAAIGALGTVDTEQTSTDDVSATVADIDSRVATLHASSDRLRGFLLDATDPNQIAALEGELTRREAEAASLEAQQRALADQVGYSTIVATFRAEGAVAPVQEAEPVGFARGLAAGAHLAAAVGRSLLAAAGFVLPFLPLLAAAALVLGWARRRAGSRRVAPGTGGVS